MSLTPDDWSALIAYAHDEASPEESAWVRTLASRDSRVAHAIAELSALRVRYAECPRAEGAREALRLVQERIARQEQAFDVLAETRRTRGGVPSTSRRTPWWILGSVAILVTGALWMRSSDESPRASYSIQSVGARHTLTKTTLLDGTRVTLAPRASLSIDPRFNRDTRTVRVHGEAYFDVTSSTGIPFSVQSGEVSVRVLGTTFRVRETPVGDTIEVTVNSGKVSVTDGTGTKIVTPGNIALATRAGITVIPAMRNRTAYIDWPNEQLVFHGASVSTMVAALEQWWNYRVMLSDPSLNDVKISAALRIGDTAAMLTTLKKLLDVNVTIDGDVLRLTPRQAEHRSSAGPQQKIPVTSSTETGR